VATKVAVVGAGSWGTAFGALVSSNADAVVWARREEVAAEISRQRTNRAYLGEVMLPESLGATSSLDEAVSEADVVAMAVPSHGFRQILGQAAPFVGESVPVVSLAKGLEQGTRLRMTEIVADLLPGRPAGVVTGPNLAREIAAGQPAATVVSMSDEDLASELQALFSARTFRVYTNTDVVGCEMAGALKNVMAIASGMVEGLGFGDNTRAALMTRGLAELARLGTAMGGRPLTFAGLAGMGDLVATCISRQSRNRHVGEQLGRGRAMSEVIDEMRMVAEGVKTSSVVVELAAVRGVEMPIAEQVVAVVQAGIPATEAVTALMGRRARPELYGFV
jgi:glycerol-3-phosphate dehydrogenase (NAD(P)+)